MCKLFPELHIIHYDTVWMLVFYKTTTKKSECNITTMQRSQTIIKEFDVWRQPLIRWSKYRSFVFQEAPLCPILLLFFFPPTTKGNKMGANTQSKNKKRYSFPSSYHEGI
jgi:hypothetical protein